MRRAKVISEVFLQQRVEQFTKVIYLLLVKTPKFTFLSNKDFQKRIVGKIFI